MSKRFQQLKEFGRTTKRPKLDISINKKPPNSRDSTYVNRQLEQSNAALWDDDEDDVILLASQVVESKIAEPKSNQAITESEMTFSEFEPKSQQHSTQRRTEPQEDFLSQMFDDDDDFVRLAAAVEEDSDKHMPSSGDVFNANPSESMIFKKPDLPSGSGRHKDTTNLQSTDTGLKMSSQLDPSAAARKQIATERQVQFLLESLEDLKKENAKLNKDLGEFKENMQTKTGETSMLRDELRRAKQQVENLKMEKLLQAEEADMQSKSKIEELAKAVEEKETQLQFKSMEYSMLKMRHDGEKKRLETTMRNTAAEDSPTTSSNDQAKPEKKSRSTTEILSIMRIRNMEISPLPKTVETNSSFITTNAFERADEHGVSKKFNTFFQQEIETIQLILAQIQLGPNTFDTDKLIESVKKVFSEFSSYVDTLEYTFYEKVQPYHDYDVLADKSDRTVGCLLLKAPLYEGERGINLRRYIAALSAVCQASEYATHLISKAKYENSPLIQIASNAIIKMGFTTEMQPYFGIIEACAVFLRNILLHLNADLEEDKDLLDLVFYFMKYLAFTRPNPWTLYELSFSVLDCAHRSLPILSKLCENSPRKNFEADRCNSIYRFSNESCFLQVYCGLMESMFPLYIPLTKTQFALQTKICLNQVRFVFDCLTKPPHFVQKMLPISDDEEEDTNEENPNSESSKNVNEDKNEDIDDEEPCTSKQAEERAKKAKSTTSHSSSNNTTCDCFTQMCLGVLTMIWLTLRQWLRFDKDVETYNVGLVSRVSVHLLHVMFCDHYHACLFREDEDTTRHYFYLICTWWKENATELQFSKLQLELLRRLHDSYAMPKDLKDEEVELNNILEDLEDWRDMVDDHESKIELKDGDTIIKNLGLLDDIFDPDVFLASLNKDHLDIKIYE